MRVLLIGATGVHGRRAAAELARLPGVDEIVLSSRSTERLEALAALLGGVEAGVSAITLDARDGVTVTRHARSCDVVVSCAGPARATEESLARAALDARVPYVSLGDDSAAFSSTLRMSAAAADAGITIVAGCGLSPGVTNVLVMAGARELNVVHEAEIAVALAPTEGLGPAKLGQLVETLGARPDPGSSGHKEPPRLTYFPPPVEWVETVASHQPESNSLPGTIGPLGVRFRLGLTQKAAMDALRVLAAVKPAGRTARHGGRRALLLRSIAAMLPTRTTSWSGARVDVRGESDGRPATVSLAVVDLVTNITAATLAYAAIKLGTGKVSVPGVHAPEQVFNPGDLLGHLATRGVRAARLEAEPV